MSSRSILLLIVIAAAGAAGYAFLARGGDQPANQPSPPPATIAAANPASPASNPAAPTTAPATGPAATIAAGDWPGFHGGGDMRGVASPLADHPVPTPIKARWTFSVEEGPAPIAASAAIVGKYAYVGDTRGHFWCLGLADGKPKWTIEIKGGIEATPLVTGGRIYVGDLNGLFHCYSAEDGKEIWKFDIESGQPIHAGANFLGDRIIYGDDAANIVCLTTDGKKAWSLTAGDRVNSAPAIGNGMAYISGCDAQLRGISIADGKQKFEMELPNLAPGSPALVGDRVIIGTDGGRLLCVAADGSKTLWTYSDFKEQAMVYASPAVEDGIVVVGARDSRVHAVGLADGKKKWTFGTRGDVDSSPVISGGKVYVASQDKKLYVLDLKTGAKLGEFQARFAIEASPAIGQGVIVFGDGRGMVYCLE
jgi:outer membrane protein assembly factor BamB